MKRLDFHICLLAVGSASVATQLVLLREFMTAFGGNELVVGVFLGIWLLAGGLGSRLAAGLAEKSPHFRVWLFLGHAALALWPFLQVAALRALPLFGVKGQMPGFASFLLLAVFLAAPYALVSGAMLPLAARLSKRPMATARVYVVDTLGDIVGGLVFGLVFVFLLSHWQSLLFFALAQIAAGAVVGASLSKPRRAFAVSLVLVVVLCGLAGADSVTRAWRYPDQEIVLWKNTPFAQLVVTKSEGQFNVWQDGIWLFSSQDFAVETLVHPALCQVKKEPEVLLVAGGVFGSISQIAKHNPVRLDYVELDPAILALDGLLYDSLEEPFVSRFTGDGRLFIKRAKSNYDAVILDLPDPDNAQLNRLYTQEFFKETQRVLKPDGVLCFTLSGAENYLDPFGLAANRTVYSALKSVFDFVLVLPGPTHFYLASSRPLNQDIASCLIQRGIETAQLEAYEIFSLTDPFRIEALAALLEEVDTRPNSDLSPWAFGHMLNNWMERSKSPQPLFWAVIVLGICFAAFAWSGSGTRFTILTTGYAGIGLELCLLMLFQVLCGYAYTALCIFMTLFLAGSALGGHLASLPGIDPAARARRAETGLALCAGLCLALAFAGVRLDGVLALFVAGYGLIPALVFVSGYFAGEQFAAVSRTEKGSACAITGRLYLADLAGACCGALLMGLVLLPRMGITGVLATVLAIKLVNRALNPSMRRTL